MRLVPPFAIAACLLCGPARGADELMLELTVGGRAVIGMPLAWGAERALLLQADGQIVSLPTPDASLVQRMAEPFRAVDGPALREPLLREFGSAYDVSLAGPYVVVHPRGSQVAWAREFDQLYRNFLHYFARRGVATAKPRFPLVAVVFSSRDEFLRYAQREGANLPSGCAGYYSTFTNRVAQYGQAGGSLADQTLIIHEASHQVAFNTGVHHRGSPPPRWLSEGLGTMFEARGVWNSGAYPARADRINAEQLAAFRRYRTRRAAGSLPEFLTGDRLFRSDSAGAYAESWALSFFLSESEPRGWARYLRITSDPSRPANPTPQRLLGEFEQAFGARLPMLEARYLRFMAQL